MIFSPKRLGVAASVLLPILLLSATLARNVQAAAPTFSVGPLAGQYYAYDSTERWLIDQGTVSVGAAAYLEVYRYDDFGFQLVGFYAAQTGNLRAPGISGAGVAVERKDAPNVALAWAYETGQPFAEYDSHGVILTLGVDFNLLGGSP